MPVRYILSSVWVRLSIFSQLSIIQSIIQYVELCCFQFTHLPCDDWENTYTLPYHHHQIGSMNHYPLFRGRSWNNGVRCMSFYIPIYCTSIGLKFGPQDTQRRCAHHDKLVTTAPHSHSSKWWMCISASKRMPVGYLNRWDSEPLAFVTRPSLLALGLQDSLPDATRTLFWAFRFDIIGYPQPRPFARS